MKWKIWLAIIGAAGAVLAATIPAAIGALKSTPPPAPGIVILGNDGIYAPGGNVYSIKRTVNNFTQMWVDGAKIIGRSLGAAPVPEPPNYPMPEPAAPRSRAEPQREPAGPSPRTTPSPGATQPSQPQPLPIAPLPELARISVEPRSAPCILVCLAGDCKFTTLGSVPMALKVGRVRQVSDCRTVGILDGEFGLRYRIKGRWSGPPGVLRTNTSVAQVLNAFPPDSCAMISPRCLQERMQTKPGPDLGPRFSESMRRSDTPSSALLFDGGEGKPCLLGLPCGPVMEPPSKVWEFSLVDESIAGDWLIMNAREKEWSDRYVEGRGHVRGGRVIAEFSRRLTPGNLYRYRVVDKSARVLSSGNFFVLTSRMQSEVEEASWRKGGRAEAGGVAWLDKLAEFGLDWDAYQELRRLE